ncbi:uncharacterized protein LOC117580214 [Drosophila guanche]|uniref:DUF4781 domain-containing protein n=1 Tax=Drosophila guanche TaxID=7266 RepID=A0A3B0JVX4_DROGU|nr:uncharacterized protein LOC117580214 [Drosophila guanche]SPP76871.1 Hypothetical predicted protein [Drosophila guanche]
MAEANNNVGAATPTAREVQQSFADSLGYAEEIIWDLLSKEQAHILKRKLRELVRDPQPSNEKIRETIFNAVWEQRKYTNRQSLTSIIYVMVVPNEQDLNRAEDCRSFSCHPVFRTRRCVTGNSGRSGDSFNCCMVFVDENGRVYPNWASYVATNELPDGVMVAPERGIYKIVHGQVRLDKYTTPAGSTKKKVLGYLDTGSAIGGFAAACIPVAAFLTLPVSAPLMAAAGAVGLATAGYATARSSAKLVDRSQHEQSINVTDREARGHWLGVIAGTVGLGAAGATSAMSAATAAGKEVGAITQLTINGFNISSIVISGTGVANGVLDLILKHQDGDNVTAMDVLQLSASLVLFTHSVYNFRLASTIINDTANSKIGSYRETLSNRQRRAFDKVSKETIRIRGNTQGKLDIIRGVNEVPSRQQFNDLYKINKQLNKEGVRAAFAPDGKGFVLNDQVATNTAELRASVQHNQGPDILGQVRQPIPATHEAAVNTRTIGGSRLLGPNPTALDGPEAANYSTGAYALQLSSVVVSGVVFVLEKYGKVLFEHIVNAESIENLITSMANNLEPEIFDFILNLTRTFMDTMLAELTSVLKFFIATESVLYHILKHILDNYRDGDYDEIVAHTVDILTAVSAYFMSLNPNSYSELLTKCDVCGGYYSICQL